MYLVIKTGKDGFFHMFGIEKKKEIDEFIQYDYLALLYEKCYGEPCKTITCSGREFRKNLAESFSSSYNFVPKLTTNIDKYKKFSNKDFKNKLICFSYCSGANIYYIPEKLCRFEKKYRAELGEYTEYMPDTNYGRV